MPDGQIFIKTKHGSVVSTALPPVSAGGGALIRTTDSDDDVNTKYVGIFVESPSSGALYEAFEFTLTARSTLYISGSASGTNANRWKWFHFHIPVGSSHWQTMEAPGSSMFSVTRPADNKDNFDSVTLDAGTYTLYVKMNFNSMDSVGYAVSIVVGDNTEASTMEFVTTI